MEQLQLDVALAGDLLQLVGVLELVGVALVDGEPDAEGGRQRADRAAPQVGGRHHLPPRDLGAARIKGFTAEAVQVQDAGELHLAHVLAALEVLAEVARHEGAAAEERGGPERRLLVLMRRPATLCV